MKTKTKHMILTTFCTLMVVMWFVASMTKELTYPMTAGIHAGMCAWVLLLVVYLYRCMGDTS